MYTQNDLGTRVGSTKPHGSSTRQRRCTAPKLGARADLILYGAPALRQLGVALVLQLTLACQFPLQSAAAESTERPSEVTDSVSPSKAEQARIANDLAQAKYYLKQSDNAPSKSSPWWASALLAAALAIVGSVITLFVTSRAAAKKAEDDRQLHYRRQKLQVGLSIRALIESLVRFKFDGTFPPAGFLSRDLLISQPRQPATFDRNAPYYQKYDLVSTVYRISALFGWMELYRTDPDFMSGDSNERDTFEKAFSKIRTLFSDDLKNIAQIVGVLTARQINCEKDGVILADDQRAIGEKMLTTPVSQIPRSVIGYAQFSECLFRFPGRHQPEQTLGEGEIGDSPQDHWVWNATSFFVGMGDASGQETDARVFRLEAVLATLKALLPDLLPSVELRNGLA